MTLQEAFDQVYNHFHAKGARLGRNPVSRECFYRSGGKASAKLRCSVGVLIPDDKYHSNMDGWDLSYFLKEKIIDLRNTKKNMKFMREMQREHDYAEDVEDFRKLLPQLGRRYGLKTPS